VAEDIHFRRLDRPAPDEVAEVGARLPGRDLQEVALARADADAQHGIGIRQHDSILERFRLSCITMSDKWGGSQPEWKAPVIKAQGALIPE
jgi:hypothetical protein